MQFLCRVHSNRTAVVLLHTSVPALALSLILSALSWIVCVLLTVRLTLWHMSTICSPLSSQFITSNFSSLLIVFCWCFTWVALHDIDLHSSLKLVRKSTAAEEENKWPARLYYQHNQCIHVTGVAVTSLPASLLQISAATDHLCQIMLNQKLSSTFQKRCKWAVLQQNRAKRNRVKQDLPV